VVRRWHRAGHSIMEYHDVARFAKIFFDFGNQMV
jgi:hypothetical protein